MLLKTYDGNISDYSAHVWVAELFLIFLSDKN